MLDDPFRGQILARGHSLGGGQVKSPGEHRQAGQHRPLGAGQQIPRPLDHRPQRLLPRRGRPRPPGQQGEPLVQPGIQLGQRHHPQPGRGQLDGQRDAIKPPADAADDRGGLLIPDQPHPVLLGAVGEQPHGLAGPDRRGVVAVGWRAHGGHQVDAFAVDAQRLAAGRQQRHVRAAPQQRVRQLRAGPDDVLAVV